MAEDDILTTDDVPTEPKRRKPDEDIDLPDLDEDTDT